ncbi:hypothetical protein [Comamonas composti]|uniref:hypothetical protein n=1 Tax=Comamonas composti TaxID=408558 RepID=UPI0012EC8995|nr:hypothetical protein [Comamonas composti]
MKQSLLLILLSNNSFAEEKDKEYYKSSTFKSLSSLPFGGVIVKNKSRNRVTEYCPDETCDRLVISSRIPEDIFNSILLFYFSRISGYIYLEEWREKIILIDSTNILTPFAKHCLNKNEKDMARCFLKWGASKYNLRIYFIRYDENKEYISRIKIEDL